MRWSDLLQWEGSALFEQSQNYERDAKSLTSASEQLEVQANGLSGSGKTVTAAQQALRRNVAAMTAPPPTTRCISKRTGLFTMSVRGEFRQRRRPRSRRT